MEKDVFLSLRISEECPFFLSQSVSVKPAPTHNGMHTIVLYKFIAGSENSRAQ